MATVFRFFTHGGAAASSIPPPALDALAPVERSAVQRLMVARRQLVEDAGIADVKSEDGYEAATVYLASVSAAANAFDLRPACRDYRSGFTTNYRALFPDGDRHYRVDVLEASVDQQFDIWVNGRKFELDSEAIMRAQALQSTWAELLAVLDRWTVEEPGHQTREEACAALGAFDVAWAAFEERYISALITIEEEARQLVVSAVGWERKIPREDPRAAKLSPCVSEAERSFVDCVAYLNSIANQKGRGRDDLRADVLEAARAVLRDLGASTEEQHYRGKEAARTLADDVLGSYLALRNYMRKVSNCLEHVDPHLCNNTGLVAKLADYEESWEVAARYVRETKMLHAICDVFAEIREAEKLAPELSTMIEDCDVELFMVLPRLVVLCFLADPLAKRTELVRSLLPHRFGPTGAAALMKVDPELKALYSRYKDTVRLLGATAGRRGPAAEAARAAIIRQAVQGENGCALSDLSEEAQAGIRELLLSVETWSLELQRHCPEDWNQCSAVLVHCLSGSDCGKGRGPKETGKFQV